MSTLPSDRGPWARADHGWEDDPTNGYGPSGPDPRPVDERAPRPGGGLPSALALLILAALAVVLMVTVVGPRTIDDRDPRTLPACAAPVAAGPVPCSLPEGLTVHRVP